MKYAFEEAAMKNEPMPENLSVFESVIYVFLRMLYWSLHNGIISREQGQKEKDKTLKKFDKLFAAMKFERRCWENSAKRTLSVNHAMMMYRKNRTLENADNIVNQLEWIDDELTVSVKPHDHGANCPICNKFFNQDHALRKPTFCEECGCRLGWKNDS